jgi:hypothetical protein
MAEIIINNNKFVDEINNNSTLDDLIEIILSTDENKDKMVTSLTIDGIQLEPEEGEKSLSRTIGQCSDINLELQSSLELAYEALNSCEVYIDTIVEKINELIGFYQTNKIQEANTLFIDLVDTVDLFVQLISKINISFSNHWEGQYRKPPIIRNLEIHLLGILKSLVPAKENNDIIMLCDLLEYELVDNLSQWKTRAIPKLLGFKNN